MPAHGDLLPICVGPALTSTFLGYSGLASSSSQKRKARTQRSTEDWLCHGLQSLNQLAGFRGDPGGKVLSVPQPHMVRRLMKDCVAVGKPTHAYTPVRAFQSLLGVGTGYVDASPAHLATGSQTVYRRGAVKLPSAAAAVVELSSIVPQPWRHRLEDGHSLLRDPCEAQLLIDAVDAPCALDPVLKRRGYDLGWLISDLFEKDMCELGRSSDVKVGVFVVARKDGLQRLIVDPKITNLLFKTPPYTALPSPASLAAMQCSSGADVHVRSGDVETCFFQYKLPASLRSYFGLPSVKLKFLRKSVRMHPSLAGYGPEDEVDFRLTITPMGWSWSVFLVQLGQADFLDDTVADSDWLLNMVPAPTVGAPWAGGGSSKTKALYIDNYASCSALILRLPKTVLSACERSF